MPPPSPLLTPTHSLRVNSVLGSMSTSHSSSCLAPPIFSVKSSPALQSLGINHSQSTQSLLGPSQAPCHNQQSPLAALTPITLLSEAHSSLANVAGSTVGSVADAKVDTLWVSHPVASTGAALGRAGAAGTGSRVGAVVGGVVAVGAGVGVEAAVGMAGPAGRVGGTALKGAALPTPLACNADALPTASLSQAVISAEQGSQASTPCSSPQPLQVHATMSVPLLPAFVRAATTPTSPAGKCGGLRRGVLLKAGGLGICLCVGLLLLHQAGVSAGFYMYLIQLQVHLSHGTSMFYLLLVPVSFLVNIYGTLLPSLQPLTILK